MFPIKFVTSVASCKLAINVESSLVKRQSSELEIPKESGCSTQKKKMIIDSKEILEGN